MTTVRHEVRFGRERTRPPAVSVDARAILPMPRPTKGPRPSGRTMLAVAYFVERSLVDGSIGSFDEAAAIVGVSGVRLSQIMRLLDLPVEIQETVILGDGEVAERRLRDRRRP